MVAAKCGTFPGVSARRLGDDLQVDRRARHHGLLEPGAGGRGQGVERAGRAGRRKAGRRRRAQSSKSERAPAARPGARAASAVAAESACRRRAGSSPGAAAGQLLPATCLLPAAVGLPAGRLRIDVRVRLSRVRLSLLPVLLHHRGHGQKALPAGARPPGARIPAPRGRASRHCGRAPRHDGGRALHAREQLHGRLGSPLKRGSRTHTQARSTVRSRMNPRGGVTMKILVAAFLVALAQPAIAEQPKHRPISVKTPDGLTISAQEWGSPSGPEILFIHGFSQSYLSWMRQVDSGLAAEFRMVTYDLRGHGNSDKPLDPARYRDSKAWGDEVQAVMDAAGLRRPVLVGWSYAGRVISDYVTTHGAGRLAGINFVDASIKADPALAGDNLKNLPLMASEDLATNIAATRAFVRGCFSKQPTPDDFEVMLSFNMMVARKSVV